MIGIYKIMNSSSPPSSSSPSPSSTLKLSILRINGKVFFPYQALNITFENYEAICKQGVVTGRAHGGKQVLGAAHRAG